MTSKSLTISGLNIQWPWTKLILTGTKTIETRGYPIPTKHLNQTLALIQTPGPKGRKAGIQKAMIVALIKFDACVKYQTKEDWLRDKKHHRVDETDAQFAFQENRPKFGWRISSVTKLAEPVPAPARKGIVFVSGCKVPKRAF